MAQAHASTMDDRDETPENGTDAPQPKKPFPGQQLALKALAVIDGFILSRRFRLIPSIIVLCGVAILIGLGSWQMSRLHWKNQLLEEMRTELAASPADLRGTPPKTKAAWEKLNYRPVKLQGTWITTRSFHLGPRTFEDQVGYQLIMPLRLDDNQVILVNRGFVRDGDAIMPIAENAGEAVVQGVGYRPDPVQPRYAPDNIPARNEWVWLDLKTMGHEVGLGSVAPVIVYEGRVADRDSYPIGGQVPLPDHNRHQQYAVTWYCLALALLGVWMTASTSKPSQTEEHKNGQTEELDPVARRGMYPEATD